MIILNKPIYLEHSPRYYTPQEFTNGMDPYLFDLLRLPYIHEGLLLFVLICAAIYFPAKIWQKFALIIFIMLGLIIALNITLKLDNEYCLEDNKQHSVEEKIDAAINSVLTDYPPLIELRDNKNLIVGFYKPENSIRYIDVIDFKIKNPNCCIYTNKWDETLGILGIDARVRYQTNGHVIFNYKVNYYEANILKEVNVKTHRMMSHCAKPLSREIVKQVYDIDD